MSLIAHDLEMFRSIGVSERTAVELAQVRRVTHSEAREICGIRYRSAHLEGLAFPYFDPQDGRILTWRVRRDNPELEADGRPIAKYVSAPDRRHLYFVPDCRAALTDPTRPAIFVESEKAVLSLADAAVRADRPIPLLLATGGCWGWRAVTGKSLSPNGVRVDEKGPLTDFNMVTWMGRDAVIAFDANVAINPKVQAARRALAAELERRGARVRVVDIPLDHGINGPDDFIGGHGTEAFWRLIDAAKPAMTTAAKKDKPAKPKQGHDVLLEDPEPWPHPVDGSALIDTLAKTFSRYIVLPEHASVALALWILHTFTFVASFTTPSLAITSPAKRCGKTLLLILVGALVPRRLFASNVTPAVLFRAIEKYQPTLLIDEADTFVKDNDELRGVLNSGHTRTTAVVIRAVGDDHDPRAFSTWCPKAIALIGKLPGTLDDRSIEIRMRRRTPSEVVERLRQDRVDDACAHLKQQAARWADDHLEVLTASDPDVPASLHDRAADCWRPLLAIADAAGGAWPVRARKAAIAISGGADEDDISTQLLNDTRVVFEAKGNPDVLPSKDIIDHLVALEDRPWAEWSHGRPLSAAKLARMLKGYGIYSAGTVRIGSNTAKGYRREAFAEAWDRYSGVVKASHGNGPNESGPDLAISKCHTQNECDGLKSVTTSMNIESCDGVTVSAPHEEEEQDDARPI